MDSLTLLLAFIISFGTLFVGAISGGVGLVLRPLLIFLGFPASIVVGSVRVSSIFGEIPTIYLLHKSRKIDWNLVLFLVVPMFIGSLIAGFVIISLVESFLEKMIGIMLLVVGVILLVKRNAGLKEEGFKFSKGKSNIIGFFGTIIISFFNTITGGMGPMFSSLYIADYGKSYISASALGKTTSYIGTGIASILFIVRGVIDWKLFAVVVPGFLLGSYFGTHFGLKKGEKWIKFLVLVVVFASAIKILFFN